MLFWQFYSCWNLMKPGSQSVSVCTPHKGRQCWSLLVKRSPQANNLWKTDCLGKTTLGAFLNLYLHVLPVSFRCFPFLPVSFRLVSFRFYPFLPVSPRFRPFLPFFARFCRIPPISSRFFPFSCFSLFLCISPVYSCLFKFLAISSQLFLFFFSSSFI